MTDLIAALPMYDWPEARAAVDAEWERLRASLRDSGIDAPERLVRRNADMPAVPGGIRDADGKIIAPDPSTLPPDALDFHTLWVHPRLLFAQTCWGPMEQGLADHVQLVGQPSYDGIEGGAGEYYSSAILMRRTSNSARSGDRPAPADGRAILPLDLMRGKRFTYNSLDSMSGMIALRGDLEAAGETLEIFADRIQSGAHRVSIVEVAEGRADVCAVDCKSWAMGLAYEPACAGVEVVGWTSRRKGLPYIMSKTLSGFRPQLLKALSDASE